MAANNRNRRNPTAQRVSRAGHTANRGGVLANTNNGRVRDIDGYRDRTRKQGSQKFPNKRKIITSGKELTTPLRRKATELQRKKYRQAVKEKVHIKHKVIKKPKKRLPASALVCVLIFFGLLITLMCSFIVLHERDVRISDLRSEIAREERREQGLKRELEIKNDINAIIDYAVNNLGMIKEDQLQKHYLNAVSDDKVIIPEERNNSNIITNLTSTISAIFN